MVMYRNLTDLFSTDPTGGMGDNYEVWKEQTKRTDRMEHTNKKSKMFRCLRESQCWNILFSPASDGLIPDILWRSILFHARLARNRQPGTQCKTTHVFFNKNLYCASQCEELLSELITQILVVLHLLISLKFWSWTLNYEVGWSDYMHLRSFKSIIKILFSPPEKYNTPHPSPAYRCKYISNHLKAIGLEEPHTLTNINGLCCLTNNARGTTDPEIYSVTWIKFRNKMAPLALVAYLATRWRHLH